MAIRKPAALLNTYNAIHTPYSRSSSSAKTTTSRPTSSTSPRDRPRKRRYATIAGNTGSHNHEHNSRNQAHDTHSHSHSHSRSPKHQQHQWPIPFHPHKVPTPYQILGCRRGDPYTKIRFTELVKIYHPDRCDHPECRNISQEIRLERYRLVVLAHAILSCPQKRSAYDSLGAGWGAHENLGSIYRGASGDHNSNGPSTTGNAPPTHGPDSAMGNATWEDWEKWRQRYNDHGNDPDPPPPQHPIFLSNTAFVSVIVMLAALGGIGQVTRAEASGRSFLLQRNEAHERAAAELEKVRRGSAGWSREERIRMFLRGRDPEGEYSEGPMSEMREEDGDGDEVGRRNPIRDVHVHEDEVDLRRRYSDTSRIGGRRDPDLYKNPP